MTIEWNTEFEEFQPLGSNETEQRTTEDGEHQENHFLIFDPQVVPPNGCRIKWTPIPTKLYRTEIVGWTPEFSWDYDSFDQVVGNGVLGNEAFDLEAGPSIPRFANPQQTDGPAFENRPWAASEGATVPQPDALLWLFDGDSDLQCGEDNSSGIPIQTNTVTVGDLSAITIPPPLNEADLVALGILDNQPFAGIPTQEYGPVVQYTKTESWNVASRLSFHNGTHFVNLQIRQDNLGVEDIHRLKFSITGSKPNRVGTFTIETTSPIAVSNGYSVESLSRWERFDTAATFLAANVPFSMALAENGSQFQNTSIIGTGATFSPVSLTGLRWYS